MKIHHGACQDNTVQEHTERYMKILESLQLLKTMTLTLFSNNNRHNGNGKQPTPSWEFSN